MGSESKHSDWTLLATEHYDSTPLAIETRGRQAEATESWKVPLPGHLHCRCWVLEVPLTEHASVIAPPPKNFMTNAAGMAKTIDP